MVLSAPYESYQSKLRGFTVIKGLFDWFECLALSDESCMEEYAVHQITVMTSSRLLTPRLYLYF